MSGVLIMAKAPRAGEVKTRLEPLLGPAGCAALQRELIRHTASWATAVAARVWLAYAPADAEEQLAGLGEAVRPFAQENGDLGRRLRAAVDVVGGEDRGPLAVVGTDAPLLGPEQVRGAWRALADGSDACLVPALDGGYSLIALARPTRAPFVLPAAEWGGPRVLELTIGALRGSALRTAQLPPVGDLDTPTDAAALLADPLCHPRSEPRSPSRRPHEDRAADLGGRPGPRRAGHNRRPAGPPRLAPGPVGDNRRRRRIARPHR